MRTLVLILSVSFLLVACDDEPEAPAATVEEVEEQPEEAEEEPEPADPRADRAPVAPDGRPTAAIDTQRSTLGFVGRKVTGSEEGSFGEWSGEVRFGEDIPSSSIEVTIQMASVTTEDARLTTHLKSDDFFDVQQFPTARFSTSRIVASEGEGGNHTVTGRLTLHGVSRAITFPATIQLSDEGLTANAEFTIDRQDFQITYPGMPDDLIEDDVTIRFDVRAPRP